MTSVRFLVEEQGFDVDIPDGFDALPCATTIVALAGPARMLSFQPYERFTDPAHLDYLRLVDEIPSRDGLVEVFEQREPPPVRIAVWRTAAGFVTVAFNPGRYGDIASYIKAVRIDDARTPGVPLVRIKSNRRRPTRRNPLHRDVLVFYRGQPPALETVRMSRLPSRLRRDALVTPEDAVVGVAYSGTIKVEYGAPRRRAARADGTAQQIAESLVA